LAEQGDQLNDTIVQKDKETLRALDFPEALQEFADVALPPDLGSGIPFPAPNLTEPGLGSHFLSFGTDSDMATELAVSTMRRVRVSPQTMEGAQETPKRQPL
jgi:hypothetical protein